MYTIFSIFEVSVLECVKWLFVIVSMMRALVHSCQMVGKWFILPELFCVNCKFSCIFYKISSSKELLKHSSPYSKRCCLLSILRGKIFMGNELIISSKSHGLVS